MNNIPSILLGVAAAVLAFQGNPAWGWFLFASVCMYTYRL